MTNNLSLLTTEEKLKASLYYSVSKICKSTASGNTVLGPYTFNKDAIELISELIYKKLEIYSEDLEAFSKNRKQTTVNVEDVKLLVRRNHHLREHLTKFTKDLAVNKTKKKKKGKQDKLDDKPSCSSDVIEIV